MRDPHVVRLCYRLETDKDTLSFREPPPISDETQEFKMFLSSDGMVDFELKNHYSSEEEARKLVDEYLKLWEFDNNLTSSSGEIHFIFEKSCIIDRDPPPPGAAVVINLEPVKIQITGSSAKLTVIKNKYPHPPHDIKLSADVETLWFRYQLYLEEREPLGSMAYFCLTFIQCMSGNSRNKAAAKYNIAKPVLNKLGELSSDVGELQTIRKMDRSTSLRAYTRHEKQWLEKAVKMLIRRVAQHDFDPQTIQNLPQITMNDLPPLNP